jgi:hypothetical protein
MPGMNSLGWSAVLALIAIAAMAADSPSVGVQVGGIEVVKKAEAPADASDKPAQASCLNRCTASDVKCGSEVRRARQECARNASLGGRDPMRVGDDYTYFCGYFSNPAIQCGSDYYTARCTARFQNRYAQCVDAMHDNIVAMRYDCFKAERDAQRMCREELRDCRAACEQ